MIVEYKTGKINVQIQHNPKAYIAYILVKFKSTEDELLAELLRKFKNEKFVGFGTNLNNKCQMMKSNVDSIYATIPEGKVLQFVSTLYRYLMTSDISSTAVASCLTKNQSYNKLHNDLKNGFTLYITGKCKNLSNKFTEKNKAIKNFSVVLGATTPKKREDIKVNKDKVKPYYEEFKASGNALTKLYFCIFYQEFDFHFSKSGNEVWINKEVSELMKYHMKENKKLVQGYVKAYLNQLGKLATKPSANDKGSAKMKAKNELTMKNINMLLEMLSEFYCLKFSDLTKLSLDASALTAMKSGIFK